MIFFISILLTFLFDQTPGIHQKLKTSQLVVVTTNGWNNIDGKMSTYQWENNKWSPVLKDIPIVTGRSGLAWGKGLHDTDLNKGKLKKEGDGNAPAGMYYLTGLFGYQDISAKMSSLKVDERTFCVDDVNSGYYNQIVKSDTVQKDWNSAETMRMKSDVYKYGIFVDYNVNPAIPGKGSCIFMHIWSKSTSPTAGCTAMTEANILKLIGFLDKSKNPVLVQVPQSEYPKLKKLYKLP
ncbi:MAG: L,D-transpeptidase family protein [Daejeonella sp.]|uniref:L,D-transpeptidase family protein n=1 Tax=Daejeonella sp. JGW-45 TaxID=3034148 RepID=UPI0023EB4ABC|nr:L,D-transpeptidase family protein [Daejeonella sp. JGW-45]